MRYLGNKTKLLGFIDSVIEKYNIEGETFMDLFAGTCSVGDHFKGKFRVSANDYMYFSMAISGAKLLNSNTPEFKKFVKKYKCTPFEWLNSKEYHPTDNFFIYNNYSPIGNRMYFTEANSIRIDGIRIEIEDLYKNETIKYNEYLFLLGSLLESALKVSNTTGTYQAFLKFWESRALKEFKIEPLEINVTNCVNCGELFCENANSLIRKIEGDIVYIDPPYTINQYTNSYHVLETIARYDSPDIFGKTGRRSSRELSAYSNKQNALFEFEDLFRQIQFDHVLVSYSNQSILKIDELVELARKFAVNNEVNVEYYDYREYATNNLSAKGLDENLKEVIIYFKKDRTINKSPLNYSGSKDAILPKLYKLLPKHISVFVDAMGGAFNVGGNVVAIDKVVYNEYNQYVFDIIKMIHDNNPEDIVMQVERIVNRFNLSKKDKKEYLILRDYYNKNKSPILLFVLQIYAFQNMIRFNNSQEMNTPVGNNEFSDGIKERILNFKCKTENIELINGKYEDLDLFSYPQDTIFYFDPPYYITNAEYNDGKRGLEGWNCEKELTLLNTLNLLNEKGYKFMLSNVISHNGKTHEILDSWVKEHNYFIYKIGVTGIKYPRKEVVVTNYEIK